MSGTIIVGVFAAVAAISIVGAWWGGREWRRGDDLTGWPQREIRGAELRDALAADINETRADR